MILGSLEYTMSEHNTISCRYLGTKCEQGDIKVRKDSLMILIDHFLAETGPFFNEIVVTFFQGILH